MVIRPATREDFDAWRVLWDGYNAFYGRAGATALPEETTRLTWARIHEASEPVHARVAEAEEGLVGLAHYLLHRSTVQAGMVCYLQDLFTAPRCRGRGVGAALIEAACAHARDLGCRRVYWQTHETNEVARALYDRVAVRSGFIVYRKDV